MNNSFYSNLSDEDISFYENWNSNSNESYLKRLMIEVFIDRVKSDPDRTAVEYCEQQLTYAELDDKSNQFARYLKDNHNTSEEKRIGIFLNPSFNLPLSILSILKSSAAFVPLDPNYPVDRLEYMIEDANLSIIVTTSDLLDNLPNTICTIVKIDQLQAEIDSCSTDTMGANLSASSLAYVIYTSGSTGRPKGVMVEHKGIANMALTEAESYQVKAGSRVMQFASINFDGSICEFFMTWAAGGVLCLIDNEERNAGRALNLLLNLKKINVVVLTPSVLSATPNTNLPELKSIGSAGESCTPDIIEKWGKDRHFTNSFGPTENTVVATAAQKEDCQDIITIGKPLANVRVYTLDEDNKQVTIGEVGEIAMAGIQVARGYHNQAELTAERFIQDPLSEDASAKLYKSGDFGRINSAGCLEYIGRKDDQVKLRGQRIELGEIENVINKMPEVTQSAVVVVTTPSGDKRIVAHVCGSVNSSNLREHISSLLPVHMMPNHFMLVDSLPMTPNDKVDKKKLQLNSNIESSEQTGPPPNSITEVKIADVWKTTLEINNISIIDNFFELGGSSLLAVQSIELLNESLGIEPDLKTITLGTLKEVAEHCDELLEKRNNSWIYKLRKVLGFV